MPDSDLALAFDISVPLANFTLSVDATVTQQITGVFGPSGAGKTTLLKVLAGLRKEATGRIQWGADVWLDSERRIQVPPERRGIGYVPQQSLLFPHVDVRANLLAGLRRGSERVPDPDAWMQRIVEVLDLTDLLGAAVHELSGGEQQRVALGRALCSGPSLLLLDEPLASLDLRLRHRILRFLLEIRDTFNVPMIVVSHQPLELQALCDEVLVLHDGQLLFRGTPHQAFTHPSVWPIADREGHPAEGYTNVMEGRIIRTGQTAAHLELLPKTRPTEGSAVMLRIPSGQVQKGDKALVSIAADSIIIALQKPEGISARNILPARIRRIETVASKVLVACELAPGGPELSVELTEEATRELELAIGRDVYVLIKTNAIHLIS